MISGECYRVLPRPSMRRQASRSTTTNSDHAHSRAQGLARQLSQASLSGLICGEQCQIASPWRKLKCMSAGCVLGICASHGLSRKALYLVAISDLITLGSSAYYSDSMLQHVTDSTTVLAGCVLGAPRAH
eukprot:4613821-Amphidinium_carterae.1